MNEESRKHIAALRAELQRVLDSGDLDDDERDAVRDAASDLEDALEGEEHGIDAVLDAMQDRIARFKGDHPTLTEAVRRVINQLSDMGI